MPRLINNPIFTHCAQCFQEIEPTPWPKIFCPECEQKLNRAGVLWLNKTAPVVIEDLEFPEDEY